MNLWESWSSPDMNLWQSWSRPVMNLWERRPGAIRPLRQPWRSMERPHRCEGAAPTVLVEACHEFVGAPPRRDAGFVL
jgi:hypothetical protein